MRIELEIPKEFEEHFKQDKFKNSFERIMADIKHSLENGDCLCAGRYEYETIEMLGKAFEDSKLAYDIDKVVEELKERTDFLNGCTKYGNKDAKQQTESYSTMMMYEVADLVDDLIEIVKQGSVSDSSNDVCEWYKVNSNAYKCYTHAEIYDARIFDWRKCPYCEKKIKIVGD